MARGITVAVYSRVEKKSRSLTVGGGMAGTIWMDGVEGMAKFIEERLRERYTEVTRLTDKRHERR